MKTQVKCEQKISIYEKMMFWFILDISRLILFEIDY